MEELRYQVDLLSALNQKLTSEEKMLRLICETSSSAFLYVNFEENIVKTLANWDYFFPGVEIKDTKDIAKLYAEVEDKYVLPLRELLFLEKTELQSDSGIIKLKDGKTWVECEVSIIYNEGNFPTDKIVRFKNVSKFQNQNDELTYMAYYDVLTGLYNRNYFVRLLADFVRKAEEKNTIVSVMFVDIDDFRKINDGLGIIVGDEVVQQFGQFLSEFKSDYVVVSHFNADIYCIAIYDPCGNRSVEYIYESIQERISSPFLLSTGQEIGISVSVGVAEYPEAAKSTLELINCAEIVMFRAKGLGKNAIQYFNAPILNDFLQNVSIENKLKEAVFCQNFTLNFQPQYHIEGKKLRGVEALIRWKDSDGKMISPAVFIPIAEKNGTIVPIGCWVIEESIKNYAAWKKKYSVDMILSLNISAIQYKRHEFIDNLMSIIRKYDVNPNDIELEITESVLIDNFIEMTEKLHVLREYGLRISLDDFGTGYSSLSYLKGLPIDTLKIDKSFVDTMLTDKNARIIMDSIVYMVKKLGFETIAEGVETQEQFDYLKSIECDCIQGYLLGKPLPGDELEKLLMKLG
ncbi:MAG: bifunctional diguanylate cyclase/phosphodiesterase [Lachnospiraceae bacterium]|nr:bifunctional diguanylate cyclase/phosphodiesterase [Lachnospiraceae bacterium]MCI7189913.1 bifunctional diguanylate cyclase/phosphodiesterase [Lachnospiraceae bacterium]MDD7626772.1 bifunctional diguanylate cyclase/phosphodiesterase [Lachnospiraceae bacterium]MDY4117986.1 bifunctional diguanylate cyclase/phosphodiesterase [Lachnospiraceae bacterium]